MINNGGTTAPERSPSPTVTYPTVPFSGPMMNTGAGGGIVPQFGFNPRSQQGAGGTAQFQNQGAGGTNQPAAGGTV